MKSRWSFVSVELKLYLDQRREEVTDPEALQEEIAMALDGLVIGGNIDGVVYRPLGTVSVMDVDAAEIQEADII